MSRKLGTIIKPDFDPEISEELKLTSTGMTAPTGTSRRWIFTMFVPEMELDEYGLPVLEPIPGTKEYYPPYIMPDHEDVKYAIYQLECCPTTDRYHIQGYMEVRKSIGFRAVQKILDHGSPWVAKAKGTKPQCIAYCEKLDTKVDCVRTMELHPENRDEGQGTRTDIKKAIALIDKEGYAALTDCEYVPMLVKYHRGFREYLKLKEQKRRWPMEVIWITGPSGSGKTALADKLAGPGAYWLKPAGEDKKVWFEEYYGEEVVVIDEFRPEDMKFNYILRLLDRYPLTLDVKGTSTQFRSKKIIITSVKHPRDCYVDDATLDSDMNHKQFMRRINKVIVVKDDRPPLSNIEDDDYEPEEEEVLASEIL